MTFKEEHLVNWGFKYNVNPKILSWFVFQTMYCTSSKCRCEMHNLTAVHIWVIFPPTLLLVILLDVPVYPPCYWSFCWTYLYIHPVTCHSAGCTCIPTLLLVILLDVPVYPPCYLSFCWTYLYIHPVTCHSAGRTCISTVTCHSAGCTCIPTLLLVILLDVPVYPPCYLSFCWTYLYIHPVTCHSTGRTCISTLLLVILLDVPVYPPCYWSFCWTYLYIHLVVEPLARSVVGHECLLLVLQVFKQSNTECTEHILLVGRVPLQFVIYPILIIAEHSQHNLNQLVATKRFIPIYNLIFNLMFWNATFYFFFKSQVTCNTFEQMRNLYFHAQFASTNPQIQGVLKTMINTSDLILYYV